MIGNTLGDITNMAAGGILSGEKKQASKRPLPVMSPENQRDGYVVGALCAAPAPRPSNTTAREFAEEPMPAWLRCAPSSGSGTGAAERAVMAVREALASGGMDSEWTRALAVSLRPLAGNGDIDAIDAILERHGWTGVQFSGPPDRERLLRDLQVTLRRGRARPMFGGA